MKMSMPFGKSTITTTVSGGDGSLLALLALLSGVVAAIIVAASFAVQIEIVMTVLSVIAVVLVLGPPAYVLARDVTWPHERRKVRAFIAQVDAAFAHQAAMLEASGPLHVTAERVRELEPTTPYVVDLEREAVPVELDALER